MAAQRTTAAKSRKSAPKRSGAAAPKPRKAARPVKAKAPAAKAKAPAPVKAMAAVKATAPTKAKGGAVATNGAKKPVAVKAVKLSSGLSRSDLSHFRELLLEKRREILGDVGTMESEAFKSGSNLSNMPIHMADVGTDNFEQEFTLGLIESERQILREIQEALLRIENGTFGICQATGKPIGKVRLEAVPWAKYTIEYSRALEQGLVRRDSGGRRDDDGGDDDEE